MPSTRIAEVSVTRFTTVLPQGMNRPDRSPPMVGLLFALLGYGVWAALPQRSIAPMLSVATSVLYFSR
jgi:hypothetical protein